MKALIVDDTASVRVLLLRLLALEGWEAVTAGSGQEAMNAFRTCRFNLVIMDVNLGNGLNGIEVAKRFRKLEPGLRIVMLSGDPANDVRVQKAGLESFLIKPFNIEDIKSILHSQTC